MLKAFIKLAGEVQLSLFMLTLHRQEICFLAGKYFCHPIK